MIATNHSHSKVPQNTDPPVPGCSVLRHFLPLVILVILSQSSLPSCQVQDANRRSDVNVHYCYIVTYRFPLAFTSAYTHNVWQIFIFYITLKLSENFVTDGLRYHCLPHNTGWVFVLKYGDIAIRLCWKKSRIIAWKHLWSYTGWFKKKSKYFWRW